jgi:hypothetical protein
MKKTLMTCLAVVALLAIASGAGAITCTVDQRPAATLLVPYFAVSFDAEGDPVRTGTDARDTLVTIGNASSAPMLAHVTVFNERSALVLDFNIALTGFDLHSMSMALILSGQLPSTPIDIDHELADGDPGLAGVGDACQRNAAAEVYPDPAGFLRIRPAVGATANPQDNTLATTVYPSPSWPPGGAFAFQVLDSLDETPDSFECDGGVDGDIEGLIHGYITIDHANYCNLSNPSEASYYTADAIGMENNLWGEVIFVSGSGLPTYGGSTVNIEADPSLSAADPIAEDNLRTFYARYVSADTFCNPANCALFATNPWNQGFGDQREPLGLKYAARWFDTAGVTSYLTVWRASSDDLGAGEQLADLIGTPVGDCSDVEPVISLTFYDEDENTVTTGVCPSPCDQPEFNIPLETQRVNIEVFSHPDWPAGWVNMVFFNAGGPNGGNFDQAWVEYDFQGASAFLSISAPGTQLDPSTCNPLGTATTLVAPVIPAIVGTGS